METIAQRLRAERERRGLSQVQLAAKAGHGIKQQTLAQIENGDIQKPRSLIYIADALEVSARWLLEGGPRRESEGKPPPPNPVVGYVGAGAEIHPIDDHVKGQGIDEAPPFPGQDGPAVAVRVRGDSMLPQLEDGWLLYYSRDRDGVPPACLGQLCVVQIHDGPLLVKKIEAGRKKGLYRLVSHNASPREDERLDWAARVRAILP
jgi:phage repressor protein C with HTH and peptisase S24 domain